MIYIMYHDLQILITIVILPLQSRADGQQKKARAMVVSRCHMSVYSYIVIVGFTSLRA